jgi:hypothetical protein
MSPSAQNTRSPLAPVTTNTLDLTGETPTRAVAAADGVWIIATRHRPGFSRHMFEINNRTVVFRLRDQKLGRPVLLVANGSDPAQAVDEVHRLERETGLPVKYIVSPGGGHHLTLDRWHEAFPEAQVLVPPLRVPHTSNGAKLMKLPRVAKMQLEDPLPQFCGELDAVMFHGLLGPGDARSAGEGGSDTFFGWMRAMMHAMKGRQPVDELWLYHHATGTILAGENLAWQYPREALKRAPFMARQMLKPDRVWIWDIARKIGEKATVAACWQRILAWPARTLMTYHDVPGTAFQGDGQAALAQAVKASGQA